MRVGKILLGGNMCVKIQRTGLRPKFYETSIMWKPKEVPNFDG